MSFSKQLAVGVIAAFVGACASQKASVADSDLARVPPEYMTSIQKQRLELARAEDEVERRNLGIQEAENQVKVAKQEEKVSKAQIERAKAAVRDAEFRRDAQAQSQAASDLNAFEQQRRVAEAHVKATEAQRELARKERDVADSHREMAESQLEWSKYQALVSSGDPAAKNVSADGLQDRIRDAERHTRDRSNALAEAQAEANQAIATYNALREDLGVGGAGEME